jgi:hypothetical protein
MQRRRQPQRRGPVAPRVEDRRVEEVQQRPHFGEVVLAAGQARRHTHRRSAPHPRRPHNKKRIDDGAGVHRSEAFPASRYLPTSAPGLGPPCPHICSGTGLAPPTCTGTGLAPPTSAPGLVRPPLAVLFWYAPAARAAQAAAAPRAPPHSIRCHPSPLPRAWDWLAKVSSACLQQSEPEAACPSARAAAPSGSSCSGP